MSSKAKQNKVKVPEVTLDVGVEAAAVSRETRPICVNKKRPVRGDVGGRASHVHAWSESERSPGGPRAASTQLLLVTTDQALFAE